MTLRRPRCRRRVIAAAACVAVLASLPPAARGDNPAPGLSGGVHVEEGFTDNVRGDANRRDSAFFTALQGHATWQRAPGGWLPHRIGGLVRGRVYSTYSNRDFAEFGPSLGYDWDLVSLTAAYRFSPDHLRVDPSASADAFADVHDMPVELRSRFGRKKRWTAILGFDSEWEFYDYDFRERSFFEENIEAGLRCRVNRWIAPRASVAYSIRDAKGDNFDREEAGLLFGFDLYMPAGVRGIFRYEKTWRNFTVGSADDPEGGRNNNFGREDDVVQFETGLDVAIPRLEAASLQVRYRYKDNKSSREDRTFDTNEAAVRLSYDFE